MDDLDRLLQNVEDNNDLSKENERQNSEQSARKSDKNLGGESYDESYGSFETVFEQLQKTEAVQSFRNSPLEGIKPHWNYVIDFKNLLSDMTLPEQVLAALRKYKYTYLRSIENIESLYDSYISTKSIDDITKKSRQELQLYFPAQENNHQQLFFLNLKEIFLRFREFNSKVRKSWKDLANGITGMSLVNESAKFMEKAQEIINSGLKTCRDTDMFLEFVASILYIPRRDLNVLEKDIQNRIYYRESFDYDYRTIFTEKISHSSSKKEENTSDAPADVETESGDTEQMLSEEPVAKAQPDKAMSQSRTANKPSDSLLSDLSRIPGKSSWNTKEPYIIRINPDILEKNQQDLDEALLFVGEPMETEQLDAYVKRALIRSISSRTPSIVREYEEFLFRTIQIQCGLIMNTFESNLYSPDLFLYHCGPLTVYSTLRRLFENRSYGICYKRLSSNKLTRFLPQEYIKAAVMRYFNQNVYIHDLPFNSIQDFNTIRQHIHSIYKHSVEKNRHKIGIAVDHKYRETGKKLSVDAV
ncbi:MAG: hypothetical protein ACOCWH_03105, partial [Spirochaetota bacterium]